MCPFPKYPAFGPQHLKIPSPSAVRNAVPRRCPKRPRATLSHPAAWARNGAGSVSNVSAQVGLGGRRPSRATPTFEP